MALTEVQFSLVQCSGSVVSDSLQPHGLQHSRPLCPSPTPGVYPNSCPLSRWCHPTISSSVVPFSSRLQSFPASGSFQMSQLLTSGGPRIGVSASTSGLGCDKYSTYITSFSLHTAHEVGSHFTGEESKVLRLWGCTGIAQVGPTAGLE